MNRRFFFGRVLGAVAATAVAPQVLAETRPELVVNRDPSVRRWVSCPFTVNGSSPAIRRIEIQYSPDQIRHLEDVTYTVTHE
jgi:hypothetical protein